MQGHHAGLIYLCSTGGCTYEVDEGVLVCLHVVLEVVRLQRDGVLSVLQQNLLPSTKNFVKSLSLEAASKPHITWQWIHDAMLDSTLPPRSGRTLGMYCEQAPSDCSRAEMLQTLHTGVLADWRTENACRLRRSLPTSSSGWCSSWVMSLSSRFRPWKNRRRPNSSRFHCAGTTERRTFDFQTVLPQHIQQTKVAPSPSRCSWTRSCGSCPARPGCPPQRSGRASRAA